MRYFYLLRPQLLYDTIAQQYYHAITLNQRPLGPLASCVKHIYMPVASNFQQVTVSISAFVIYTDSTKSVISTMARLHEFLLEHNYQMIQPNIWAYEQKRYAQ